MKYRVRVPATSGNLGPGFDSMGLAVDLYNEYRFHYGLEGEDSLMKTASDAVFAYLAKPAQPVKIEVAANIPMARGLGSSAACVVAGVLAANAYTGNTLDQDTLLNIATAVEGHPDNVAPALLGGVTLCLDYQGVRYHQFMPQKQLDFVALVPDYELSTEKARQVLPDTVPFADAVHNSAHSSFLALSLYLGKREDLSFALDDRLHQPYRKSLMPDYQQVVDQLIKLGEDAIYLSGAGPTIMCINKNGKALVEQWQKLPIAQKRKAYQLKISTGATIVEE